MSSEPSQLDPIALALKCAEICEQHKAADIKVFDVREKTILADAFVVCSGTSLPHLRALAEHIRRTLLDEGIQPRGRDGSPSSQWLVLDYGVIIIHVLMPELRRYYALEDLWDQSKVIYAGGLPLPEPKNPAAGLQLPPPPQLDAAALADLDAGFPVDTSFLEVEGDAEDSL